MSDDDFETALVEALTALVDDAFTFESLFEEAEAAKFPWEDGG